jgi:hypothetical protein
MSGPTDIGKIKFITSFLSWLIPAQLWIQMTEAKFLLTEKNNKGDILSDNTF